MDPSKSPVINKKTGWTIIDQSSPKVITQVIRPKVLKLDAIGCDNIIKKMDHERNLVNLQKEYLQQNRHNLRVKLKERQNAVDLLHKKSGQPVVSNVGFNTFDTAMKQYRD